MKTEEIKKSTFTYETATPSEKKAILEMRRKEKERHKRVINKLKNININQGK